MFFNAKSSDVIDVIVESLYPFTMPCLVRLLLAVTVSQILLVFDDFDSFEEY